MNKRRKLKYKGSLGYIKPRTSPCRQNKYYLHKVSFLKGLCETSTDCCKYFRTEHQNFIIFKLHEEKKVMTISGGSLRQNTCAVKGRVSRVNNEINKENFPFVSTAVINK